MANGTTPASDINVISCYGVATNGRLVGTQLGDGTGRNNSITVIPQGAGAFLYMHQTRSRGNDLTLTPSPVRVPGAVRFGSGSYAKDANGLVTQVNFQGELTPGFKSLKQRTVAEWSGFSHVAVNMTFNATYDLALAAQHNGNSLNKLVVGGNMQLVRTSGQEASNLVIAAGSTLEARKYQVNVPQPPLFIFGGNSCPVNSIPFGVAPMLNCQIPQAPQNMIESDPKAMNLTVSVAMPNAKLEGNFTASDALFDASNTDYAPTKTSFSGKVYEGDGAGGHRLLLDGRVQAGNTGFNLYNNLQAQSASNYAKRNASFDGTVFLKNRPASGLSLAFQEGAYGAGVVTGTFFWGGKSFTIRANAATFTGAGNLVFTNSDGAAFTLDSGAPNQAVTLFKGGASVGMMNLTTKRIDYQDGSFQQF